jgi:hypothetical protein
MTISTNPQQVLKHLYINDLVHDIDFISSTTYQKRGSEMKSYVKLVIRFMWYVFEFSCLSSEFKSPYNSFYICICSDYNNAYEIWHRITFENF